jgi:hypothetical protein
MAEEIVYNYFSQDYALITRKEKPFDPGHGHIQRWIIHDNTGG